jgi:hypothetical protein
MSDDTYSPFEDNETPPSMEERKKMALERGCKEILPGIWDIREHDDIFQEEEDKFGHLCDEVERPSAYGGYFQNGKCRACGFTLDEETQLALNLLAFKG